MSSIPLDDIPDSLRWRDVYVTDPDGNLITAIRVYTQQEANLRCIPYHMNWREAYSKRIIKAGDNILCDDNYVIPVTFIDYKSKNPHIILPTGYWCLQKAGRYTRDWDRDSTLKSTFITSSPHGIKTPNKQLSFKLATITLRRLVLNYLNNGFNPAKAYGDTFRRKYPRAVDVTNVFKHPRTRYILMSESLHWFDKSGITPDVVLKKWFEKVFDSPTAVPEDLNEAMFLYAKIHPDMEVKGLTNPKMLPQQNLFLGDQQHFQQLQGAPTEQPNTTPRIPNYTPLSKMDNTGNVIEEVECVSEQVQ